MSCSSYNLSGIPIECSNVGGVKNVWLISTDDVLSIQIGSLYTLFNLEHYDGGGSNIWLIITEYEYNNIYKDKNIRFYGEYDGTVYDFILTPDKHYFLASDNCMCINLTDYHNIFLGIIDYISYAYVNIELDEISDEFLYMNCTEQWKKYSFKKGNASFTNTSNKDVKSNTSFVTTELNMKFNKMDRYKNLEIKSLMNTNLYALVLDNNGLYWFIGVDSYVSISNVVAQTGTEMTESNQYNITLTSMTKKLPYEITQDTLHWFSLQ